MDYLFFVIFSLVIGFFVFKLVKHGGFRAAMFGAGIKNKVGEVKGNGPKLMNLSLRIYELDSAPEKAIGLELVAKSVASYQMTPITLSVAEANRLTALIESVTNVKKGT